ncbi:MAG TPA: hypothetical protein PLV06_06160 [Bacteroidales bacterium]|nr:hypothetical protein [Bacteroidales bacterium]HPJ58802.1 hypothetical protein [Bacteroidales bacterium]HPR11952.1 hypothetical protein [Bacteroidales bacterium]HRW85756.1 hypothetical protein [Bacteroidales bacterium]
MELFNILVIGETDWEEHKDFRLYIEKSFSKVNLKVCDKDLFFIDSTHSWIKVDGVIWRGQFEIDEELQRHLLEIISLSEVKCINPVESILHHGSNISMYNALCKFGINVLKKGAYLIGSSSLDFIDPIFPIVIKTGNYHMGYGKALAKDAETWRDFLDISVLLEKPVSLEPFVPYTMDVRCQYISGEVKAILRQPSHWKANVDPVKVSKFNPPEELIDDTKNFAQYIGADILGLDWILNQDNKWLVLEGNLSPGLNDLKPDRQKINDLLRNKL